MSYRNTEVLQVKGQYGNGEGGEALTYLRLGSDFQKDEGAIFERGICSPVCDGNVQKCPNILLKSVRFLKYVWQFFNIIHKRVYAISLTDVDVEFHRPVHTHGSFILNCSSGNYLFQQKHPRQALGQLLCCAFWMLSKHFFVCGPILVCFDN